MRKVDVMDKALRDWRFGGLLLSTALAWLYYPIFSAMAREWYTNPNHSHGFLIPIISGYFVWRRKEEAKALAIRPTNLGIPLLIGGLIIYVLGEFGAAYTTTRMSFFFVLAGVILFIYGMPVFRWLCLPFFYLLFMIPVPQYLYDAIAFPLKVFITNYSVLCLQILGLPALREGNIISLRDTTLQVVDACSGIRSLVSLIAIGVAYAVISQKSNWKKAILVVSTIPIAIVTNALRVIITGILATFYGSGAAEGFFHEFAGVAVFMMSVVVLIGIGALLNRMGKSG